MSLPGINCELAAAVRRVNALRAANPEAQRPEFDHEAWKRLERSLDASCRAGDSERALAAIERWECATREGLAHLLLHAPLEEAA